VDPASTRKLASTRVYASTVHCRLDIGACRSWRIAGIATLTMEMSITTTRMLAQQIARIRNRRRWLSSGIRVRSGRWPLLTEILMLATLEFRACSKSNHSRYPSALSPRRA
jgi:hypothetical protein